MAVPARDQGRYLGGRPPYGYRLADAGPHPNKMRANWGRRAHRLEPDPETEHVVRWMFAQRFAGHSAARVAPALNDAGVPCPSAADPTRNPHRAGSAWTVRTVGSILASPRYTGRQVWNWQPTELQLFDPADISLGHRQVQRWNLPAGWAISPYRRHGTPWYRTPWYRLHLLIWTTSRSAAIYGAEYRGIIQYDLLAGNVFRLHRLRQAAESPMLKTPPRSIAPRWWQWPANTGP